MFTLHHSSTLDLPLGKVVDQSHSGAIFGNTKITDLVFADEAVFHAESLNILVLALEALYKKVKLFVLQVSAPRLRFYYCVWRGHSYLGKPHISW